MSTRRRRLPGRLIEELTKIRRDIHRNPETAFQEHRTSELIAGFLTDLGLEVTTGVGRTGVVGLLRGRSRKRTVGLRADMDALPMKEETGLPYASRNDNMHACGHDGHVAILLGTAAVLVRERERLAGSVKFVFQPAEERGLGAAAMIRDGVLKNPTVNAVFGLHGWPDLSVGQIGIRYGTMAASAEAFRLTIIGKGCHAAYPHRGIDPILVAAKVVDNLQVLVSREREATDPAVISVGMIHGGTAPNRIPDQVVMQGTVRALTEETRKELRGGIRRIVGSTTRAFGARYRLNLIPGGTSPLINDGRMTDLVREVGTAVMGENNVVEFDRPTMGGEDFSEYLRFAPGCFFRLGLRRKGEKDPASIHQSKFDFNDAAIEPGVLVMAEVARRFLAG